MKRTCLSCKHLVRDLETPPEVPGEFFWCCGLNQNFELSEEQEVAIDAMSHAQEARAYARLCNRFSGYDWADHDERELQHERERLLALNAIVKDFKGEVPMILGDYGSFCII